MLFINSRLSRQRRVPPEFRTTACVSWYGTVMVTRPAFTPGGSVQSDTDGVEEVLDEVGVGVGVADERVGRTHTPASQATPARQHLSPQQVVPRLHEPLPSEQQNSVAGK